MSPEDDKKRQAVDQAVREVRDGQVDAFEFIVRSFETSLRAWLAVQSPPGVDVDDISQRSFFAAFTLCLESSYLVRQMAEVDDAVCSEPKWKLRSRHVAVCLSDRDAV